MPRRLADTVARRLGVEQLTIDTSHSPFLIQPAGTGRATRARDDHQAHGSARPPLVLASWPAGAEVMPQATHVPAAVVERSLARAVAALLETLPRTSLATQQDFAEDRTIEPTPPLASRHPRDLCGVDERKPRGAGKAVQPSKRHSCERALKYAPQVPQPSRIVVRQCRWPAIYFPLGGPGAYGVRCPDLCIR